MEKRFDGGWIANPEQVNMVHMKRPVAALKNIAMTSSANYNPQSERQPMIFTVGLMSYAPNYLGVDAFLTNIWPTVKKAYPEMTYKLAGKGIPEEYQQKWEKIDGVELLGFVEDLEPLYEQCLATVVPVDSGGGTCIKTLEAMAYSRIPLATQFGARGYDDTVGKTVFVYHNAEEFLDILNKQIMDESARSLNEQNAKRYVDDNYSQANFTKTVVDYINQAMSK